MLYSDSSHFTQIKHDNFNQERTSGWISPDSGIYRCVHCGDEIAVNKGNPLPPQNHHHHQSNTSIRWKLLAVAVQKN